jgi:diguanylate cyclase (GGDEF)-like protein
MLPAHVIETPLVPAPMTTATTDTTDYFQVFEHLPVPVVLLDADGGVCDLNPEAARLLDAAVLTDGAYPGDAQQRLGQPVDALFPWLPPSPRLRAYQVQGEKFECSVSSGGRTRVFEGRVSGLRDARGRLTGSVVVLNEVTAHKVLADRLKRLARTDSLTGVSNRGHLLAIAERETARARRYARPLSVMLIDVDHFKQVNDTQGHAVGDEVLVRLTHTMAATLRSTDALGRLGGEEFAILLPETDEAAAVAAGERIRTRVAQTVYHAQAGAVHPTVSIGVAALDPSDRDFSALLGRADEALYRAKARGRNLVVAAALGRPSVEAARAAGGAWESGTFPLSDQALAMRARTRQS